MSMKISNDTIGNRNCDLLAFNAFPQPTASPRALKLSVLTNNYRRLHNAVSCEGLELYPNFPIRYSWPRDLRIRHRILLTFITKRFTLVCQIVSFMTHSD